jgi:cysteinyl-tRNA synthetase
MREFIQRIQQVHAYEADQNHKPLPEKVFTLEQQFFDALADDLNMPNALAAVFKFIRQVNPFLDRGELSEGERRQILETLRKVNEVLGIFDLELQPLSEVEEELLRRREAARKQKNWEEADRLRNELQQQGIAVKDAPQGTLWERI